MRISLKSSWMSIRAFQEPFDKIDSFEPVLELPQKKASAKANALLRTTTVQIRSNPIFFIEVPQSIEPTVKD